MIKLSSLKAHWTLFTSLQLIFLNHTKIRKHNINHIGKDNIDTSIFIGTTTSS